MYVEMPGIEPGAFNMQSERSTTELHPHATRVLMSFFIVIYMYIGNGNTCTYNYLAGS